MPTLLNFNSARLSNNTQFIASIPTEPDSYLLLSMGLYVPVSINTVVINANTLWFTPFEFAETISLTLNMDGIQVADSVIAPNGFEASNLILQSVFENVPIGHHAFNLSVSKQNENANVVAPVTMTGSVFG